MLYNVIVYRVRNGKESEFESFGFETFPEATDAAQRIASSLPEEGWLTDWQVSVHTNAEELLALCLDDADDERDIDADIRIIRACR